MGLRGVKSFSKYFGFPINKGKKLFMSAMTNIIEKVQQKLEGWKVRHLSMAGRVVLAKLVLEPIPLTIYKQQLFMLNWLIT